MNLRVTADAGKATLHWDGGSSRCAIGPGGIAHKQSEGDGVTPIGIFPIRHVLYRADRIAPLQTGLPLSTIAPDDGWCDAPDDPAYNRPVKLPYPASAEQLWREDHVYDIIVVLGFNDDPVVPGKGSAIFLHLAKADYATTAGCVALALPDMLAVLAQLKPGDFTEIA
jgi:L,D-peptidoglycan transpeptidase YkuD (ErfK/YbiS/YcfS/YnhG family)